MNRIEKLLANLNPGLFAKLHETQKAVKLLLGKYDKNFPTYTDHSIEHVTEVFTLAADLLTPEELENLNADELYILGCSCFLHDVGMCIPEERIQELVSTETYTHYRTIYQDSSTEDFLRSIHHELSHDFILKEWESLKLENEKYAKAIALVAQGHRKVDLTNVEVYDSKFFVKGGRDFVCLPYIACVLRIADELDVTNVRTPRLLTKYYMPNNEQSIKEWEKHIATTQVNFTEDKVLFDVICTNQNMFAALQEQFEKIQGTLNYCQKVIRGIANTEKRQFSLRIKEVEPKFRFEGFDPKGIRYSFDVQNVITAFIGDDLYYEKLVAVREAVQNAVDSCRYRQSILKDLHKSKISIFVDDDRIVIEDNGMGMDEFIIENYFGRLGSSYYEQEKVKNTYEAIGQFGVGVFSYFLISDYVDIETKTDKSKTLRFRIDKDPKSYFHFFDSSTRSENGTTVTLYLKEEFRNKYNEDIIETYIRRIFRFIEFPILVFDTDTKSKVESSSFEIDYHQDVASKFNVIKHGEIPGLRLLKVQLENESYIGQCALVVQKDDRNPWKSLDPLFDFENVHFGDVRNTYSSIINFSQKGVFIASYSSYVLNYVYGNIDLLRKLKINIDRNSFSEVRYIYEIVIDFEIAFIEKMYSEFFVEKNLIERVELTERFLLYYLDSIPIYKANRYIAVFEQMFHFSVYFNGSFSVYSLGKIISEFETVAVSVDIDFTKEVSPNLNIPVIILVNSSLARQNKIRAVLNGFYKMKPQVYYDGYDKTLTAYTKDNDTIDKLLEDTSYFIRTNYVYSDLKAVSVPTFIGNSYIDYGINLNHPFIAGYIDFLKLDNRNSFLNKVFNSVFNLINQLHEDINKPSLQDINALVVKLDEQYQYTFKQEDFLIKIA